MNIERCKHAITYLVVATLALGQAVSAKPYKGAEYRTRSSYLYGKFEASIKTNGREGMLASFFTYNDNYPTTPWNEIDVELMGRYTDDVQFNTITPGQTNHVSHQFVPFNPALEYHVYGFEWTPTYVAWFIDSVEVYRQTGSHIATLNAAQKIMMNVWPPNYPNWAGSWNDAVLPAFAHYDWVKYASYTPGSGTHGTDNNFTPQWMDNFDSWDQTRWDKATHTWDGNNCDFIYANAVFQDGKLILCLTKETAIGYTDNVAPTPLWARVEGRNIRIMFAEEVDTASATTAANYGVAGVTIQSVRLLEDQKTVLLVAPGVDTTSATAMIVQNIRDRWTTPNTLQPRAVLLMRTTPLTGSFNINVGGPAQPRYFADQVWSPLVEYGRVDGQTGYFPGVPISGTTEPEIYRSEVSGLCEYKIRVANGRYAVILMMAENYFTSAQQRTMNITVQGTRIETGLDLFSRAGFRSAFQKAAFAEVTDGVLTIHMQGVLDQPLLNGISVTPITDVKERSAGSTPEGFRLEQNYPNPFNPKTTIGFTVQASGFVSLKVFDVLGREVAALLNKEIGGGAYEVSWDSTTSPSGTYFYSLTSGPFTQTKRMLVLK